MTTLEVIAGEAMRRWYHPAAEALAGALAVSRAVADEARRSAMRWRSPKPIPARHGRPLRSCVTAAGRYRF
jgi:hypothetical protein